DGTAAVSNLFGIQVTGAPGVLIGGTSASARNVVSGNSGSGIILFGGASNTQIQGNYIGTNLAGTAKIANGDGVPAGTSMSTTIGGTAAGARNLISGNANGIFLDVEAANVQIQGNYIGTDLNGTAKVANGFGIAVQTTSLFTIGGTTSAARNVISGNITGVN